MKKTNYYVIGEIFCIGENENGKVDITLVSENDKILRICIPRKSCNVKNWNVSDYIKVSGKIFSLEDTDDGNLNKIEFSSAVLQKLFTVDSHNPKVDYCAPFTLCGDLLTVTPIDAENYILTLASDDGVYTIYVDSYTLFKDIAKLNLQKKFRINGIVSITSYSRYAFEGVISKINYCATQIVEV